MINHLLNKRSLFFVFSFLLVSLLHSVYAANGKVNGGTTVCQSVANQVNLSLSGHTGTVVKWQSAQAPYTTWTDFANTSTTFTVSNLQSSTAYRAVLQNGSQQQLSDTALIKVSPMTQAGSVTCNINNTCPGTVVTFNLVGTVVGSVLKWQYELWSQPNNWIDINSTATSIQITVVSSLRVRAIVQSAPCSQGISGFWNVQVYTMPLGTFLQDNPRWSRPGSWVCDVIPNATIDVVIPDFVKHATNFVNVDTNVEANNIYVGEYAGLNFGTSVGKTLTIRGNFTLANGSNFRPEGGTINFGGSGPQNIPAVTYNGLRISGGGPKTLSGNTTVTGTLTLDNGIVYLGNYNLVLEGNASISGGNASSYVVANGTGRLIIKNIGSGGRTGNITFPVGANASSYTPIIINNTGTADDYSVGMYNVLNSSYNSGSPAGNIVTSNAVGKAWILGESNAGGSNLMLSVQWNQADELSGFNRTNAQLNAYNGAGTALSGAVFNGTNPYTLRVNNVTTLYPLGITSSGTQPPPPPPAVSVGGNVTGGGTVCSGSTSGVLTLSGHTGTVLKWQCASSPFTSWVDINHTGTQFTSGPLTNTNAFRAVVQNGSASVAYSTSTLVTVGGSGGVTYSSGSTEKIPGGVYCGITVTGGGDKLLTGDVTVTGTLTLTNGFIYLDKHDLIITESGNITGQNIKSYVIINGTGRLIQQGVGAGGRTGNILYPVGVSSTRYSPVLLSNSGTKDAISVRVLNHQNSSYNGNNPTGTTFQKEAVAKTWLINEEVLGGSNLNVTLEWTAADELPGFTRPNAMMVAYNGAGTGLVGGAASGSNPYTFSHSSITSLTPLAIYNNNLPPATVAGAVTGGTTVCMGLASDVLTLSGHVGTILSWQSAPAPFTTWTTINNTIATYKAPVIWQTTAFRAVVRSGNGTQLFSTQTVVTAAPITVGGAANTSTPNICAGNTASVSLSGQTGTVVKWQVANNTRFNNWTDITNSANATLNTALTVTSQLRAVVQSGNCAIAYSTPITVAVTASGIWNGTNNTSWSDVANWCGSVPTASTNVVVPDKNAVKFSPVINVTNAVANHISVQPNGSLSFASGSNRLTVLGDITVAGTFDASQGTVSFAGTASQKIPGSTYGTLEISNTAGASLTGNVLVNGTLKLTKGKILLGDYDLTISATATISGGDVSSYIVTNGLGRLIQQNVGLGGRTGNILFPVGASASSYTPMVMNNTGTRDDFTVRLLNHINTSYNGNNPTGVTYTTNAVGKTWIINEIATGGSILALTFQWNGTDELSGFTRNNATINRFNGAGIAQFTGAASGSNPYTLQCSGVTTLNPFGIVSGPPAPPQTSGSIVFNGTSAQNMLAGTYCGITVNNASGVLLTGNATITCNLTLTNGKLLLGNFDLILSSTASIIGGNANSFVVTNGTGRIIQQGIGAGGRTGAIVYPVGGSATLYSPLTLTNTGTSDAFALRVLNFQNGSYNGNNPTGTTLSSGAVAKTWLLNEGVAGGSNLNVQVQWTGADELPSFNRNNLMMVTYNGAGTNVSTGAATGSNPYMYTKNGLTGVFPIGVRNLASSFMVAKPKAGESAMPNKQTTKITANKQALTLVQVYPNPCNELLVVNIPAMETAAKATIEITDITGKTIKTWNDIHVDQAQQIDLDVATFKTGLYFLNVQLGDTHKAIKFIKQ